jgi:hypothetical protein
LVKTAQWDFRQAQFPDHQSGSARDSREGDEPARIQIRGDRRVDCAAGIFTGLTPKLDIAYAAASSVGPMPWPVTSPRTNNKPSRAGRVDDSELHTAASR